MALIPSWRSDKRGGASSKAGGRSGARKPAKKAKKPARKAPAARPARELEQRHLDLIGLACLGAALYSGFVLYGGWDGGKVGEGLQDGLDWLAGASAYALPMLLAGLGAALVLRPFVRYPGALNAGAILLVAGLLLAFAAETAGIGPERPVRGDEFFNPDYFTEHGGAVGEVLYWAATTLFQTIGAHIIAVLLVISGALLLTGRPIASLLRSGAEAGQRAREATGEMARTAKQVRAGRGDVGNQVTYPFGPSGPEAVTDFEDPGETIELEDDEFATEAVGTVEHPAAEGNEEADGPLIPDPAAPVVEVKGDPETVGGLPEDGEAEIEILKTPMGARRTTGGITESEEISYKLPPPKALKRT
ncbi:MAG: hypothetical protein JJE23_15095, partial [Thermoleophilia bacterium]|nr:hypothetical protein [Thermoleophilia bacterium]